MFPPFQSLRKSWDTDCFDGRAFGGGAELMVPVLLSADDARLSEITIGNLEDAGYEVDYSVADPFPEFGDGCRCGASALTTLPSVDVEPIPPLSASGMEKAVQYGRSVLAGLSDLSNSSRDVSVPGIKLAPLVVEVYYKEGDVIYPIEVEA